MAEESRKRSRFDQSEPESRRASRFDRRSRSPTAKNAETRRSRSPARDTDSPTSAEQKKDAASAAAAAAAKINAQIHAKKGIQHVDVPPIRSVGPKFHKTQPQLTSVPLACETGHDEISLQRT